MTANKSSTISVYLLAGVATTQTAFNECRDKLDRLFRSDGLEPLIHIFHPYGDASRNLYRQIMEVGTDLTNRVAMGRVGGRAVFNKIKMTFQGEADQPLLLIGHSGGGVAAYQAGKMLHRQKLSRNMRIVQVGSPRIPIHPELRDKVSYFHSVDDTGLLNDPVSRIGSWGGWSSDKSIVPKWNQMKYAPGIVEGIPLIGGHAHYFRHQEPYIDQDAICNLDKTIDRVRLWLKGWS